MAPLRWFPLVSTAAPLRSGSVELELNDVIAEGILLHIRRAGAVRPKRETTHVRRRRSLRAIHGALESAGGSPTHRFYRSARPGTVPRRWVRDRGIVLRPCRTEAAGSCARHR